MTTDIRSAPEEFDAPWMTDALEEAGVARGSVVTKLDFEGYVGTGQMSRNGRFRLTWTDPDDRPATVIAKFPSDDPTTRTSAFESGAYRAEYGFYAEIAPTVDVRTPTCWVARFDADSQRCVLVMEDMVHSVQGDQFAGCSPEDAQLAIGQAVALHAPRWGDPRLSGLIALQPADEHRAELLDGYYRVAVGGCLDRLGHNFSDDVVSLIERFAPLVGRWSLGTETPQTVVHGDFRPDNFLFGRAAEAPPLVVVDWQTVSKGLGPADVAYLLGGAFAGDLRLEVERDLVEGYRQRLNAAGVAYAEEDCWRDYRWGSLHGVVISVLAATMAEQTERGDRMLTLMAVRHAQHALHLGALDLVASAS